MNGVAERPLVVQSDRTILLEVQNPFFEDARDALLRFAQLIKSPEYFHTYRLTPLSIWNAASTGMTPDTIITLLERFSRFPLPQIIRTTISSWHSKYGLLTLIRKNEKLILTSKDSALFTTMISNKKIKKYIYTVIDENSALILEWARGQIKHESVQAGYPIVDSAGFAEGDPLPCTIALTTSLRPYQREAVMVFTNYTIQGGSGIIVLPCGAGKTIIGIALLASINQYTLILVTSITAARQWKRELCKKTNLSADTIGEYSGEKKEIRPITIATYNILIHNTKNPLQFPHMKRLNEIHWGIIIYDEVHLLPAPVFRFVSEVQGTRRLGLTATLIREDGKETDVFSLIGPKLYDIPWKPLEKQGWIAKLYCTEIRISLSKDEQYSYFSKTRQEQFKFAATHTKKIGIIRLLLNRHHEDHILIIGQYLSQLKKIAQLIHAPCITGHTPNNERDTLYRDFRHGKIPVLVVSKVANYAVDLPFANIGIQVSGTFGSRQEEAQRIGRILRPYQGKTAHFYSIVTRDTVEQDFAEKRQLFLIEQGYHYKICNEETFVTPLPR